MNAHNEQRRAKRRLMRQLSLSPRQYVRLRTAWRRREKQQQEQVNALPSR